MNATIKVTGEIKLSFEENSLEIQKALDRYKQEFKLSSICDPISSMIDHVALSVMLYGFAEEIRGVGFVFMEGWGPKREPFSGITITEAYKNVKSSLPYTLPLTK